MSNLTEQVAELKEALSTMRETIADERAEWLADKQLINAKIEDLEAKLEAAGDVDPDISDIIAEVKELTGDVEDINKEDAPEVTETPAPEANA